MNLEPLLADAYPILLETTVGTRDVAELEGALDALPLGAPVDRCFSFTISVGAVFGVELADGRRLAVKAHQPSMTLGRLEAIHRAQGHLAGAAYPALDPSSRRRRSASASRRSTSGSTKETWSWT